MDQNNPRRRADDPPRKPGDDTPDPADARAGRADHAFHIGERDPENESDMPSATPTGIYTPIDPLAPPANAEPVTEDEG